MIFKKLQKKREQNFRQKHKTLEIVVLVFFFHNKIENPEYDFCWHFCGRDIPWS